MEERAYTVLVGISEHAPVPSILAWAVDQAASRGGRVVALRGWRPTAPQTGSRVTPSPLSEDPVEGEAAAREALEEEIAAVLGPDHEVEVRLVVGGRRKTLVAASAEADLVVVGAPRRPEASTRPWQLRRLVYTAHCPVVVFPPEVSGEPPTALERAGESALRSVVRAAGHAGRPGVRPPSISRD
jgi:nucleotide-binding universal stress UspA family protein